MLASVLPRVLVAAGMLPEALRPFVWSDLYETFVVRGLAGHHLPYWDVDFEYPPGMGYVAGLLSLLTSDAALCLAGWGVVLAVSAGAAGYALARAAGAARTLRFWCVTPQMLLLSGANYDVLPTALVAGAVLAARAGHDVPSMLALGLGAAAKFFPAVCAPLVALRSWSRGRGRAARAAAVFVGALVGIYLPSLLAPRSSGTGLSFYAYDLGTGGGSVWGLASAPLLGLGADPVTLSLAIAIVSSAGLAVTYLFVVAPRARSADPTGVFALAMLAVLLWNRIYSPQYSIWVLPFFVLLPLKASTFALLAVADVAVFVGLYPLMLVRWPGGDALGSALLALAAAGIVLRHAALLLAWREVLSLVPKPPTLALCTSVPRLR